jgi:hypothetical protein
MWQWDIADNSGHGGFNATSDRGQLRRFRPRLTVRPAMLVAADEVIE